MKKIFKYLVVMISSFVLIGTAQAQTIDHFHSEMDTDVLIKEDVNGSALAVGTNAEMKGKAQGISFVLGNNAIFSGTSDYAALIGNSVLVKGVINNDAFILGNVVEIDEKAQLQRDVIIVGSNVEISGNIGRNVSIYASTVNLKNAEVLGNVKIYSNNINVDNSTIVNGNLSYPCDANIKMSKDSIKGKVIKTDAIESDNNGVMTFVMGKFWSFMSLMLVFAVLSLVAPKIFIKMQKEYDKFDFNKGIEVFTKGLVFLILVPIIVFILFLMSIGIPLSLIFLALYFIFMYLSTVFTGYLLGYKLWQKFFDKDINMLVVGIFGLAILFILNLIPGINAIISTITVILGIGIIYDTILNKLGSN